MPYTPDDPETLATIGDVLAVGVTTRDSVLKQLGQPDAIYDSGRLWVFADADYEGGYFYIDLAGTYDQQQHGEVLFLISEFDDQEVLSGFRIEKASVGGGGSQCTDSRFCYLKSMNGLNLWVYRLATDDEEASAWSFGDPGEQCEVYLHANLSGMSNPILLNGENMGIGPVGGFFRWRLDPGEHQIDVYSWNDAERREPQTRHVFACRAGERLFFKTKRSLWNPNKVKSLAPVTEAKGRKDIKARRLIAPISEGPSDASIDRP